jgi:hypothetical protein
VRRIGKRSLAGEYGLFWPFGHLGYKAGDKTKGTN